MKEIVQIVWWKFSTKLLLKEIVLVVRMILRWHDMATLCYKHMISYDLVRCDMKEYHDTGICIAMKIYGIWKYVSMYISMIGMVIQHKCFEVVVCQFSLAPHLLCFWISISTFPKIAPLQVSQGRHQHFHLHRMASNCFPKAIHPRWSQRKATRASTCMA